MSEKPFMGRTVSGLAIIARCLAGIGGAGPRVATMAPGISNRRQGELLRAVFAVLLEQPEGVSGRDVLTRMAERTPLNLSLIHI